MKGGYKYLNSDRMAESEANANTNTNATLSIIDVAGKTVFNGTTLLDTRTVIPVNLTSGFYILKVSTNNGTLYTTKFLAE